MSLREIKSAMDEEDDTGGAWIVTFADMMTLILVFFILLYTISDFEDEAYKQSLKIEPRK